MEGVCASETHSQSVVLEDSRNSFRRSRKSWRAMIVASRRRIGVESGRGREAAFCTDEAKFSIFTTSSIGKCDAFGVNGGIGPLDRKGSYMLKMESHGILSFSRCGLQMIVSLLKPSERSVGRRV